MTSAYDILNDPDHLKLLVEYGRSLGTNGQMIRRYLEAEAKKEQFLNHILHPVFDKIREYYRAKELTNYFNNRDNKSGYFNRSLSK